VAHRHLARAEASETDRPARSGSPKSSAPAPRPIEVEHAAPLDVRHEFEIIARTSSSQIARIQALRELAKLDTETTSSSEGDLRLHLLTARQRIRELQAAQFELPRYMPGVDEWFDALPADVEDWRQLPDAPVELLDKSGRAHHVLAEEVWLFVDHLGWTTPPVYEPDDEVIEEWRARIAEYDTQRAQLAPEPED
jgi:hypothetical protein